jgi:hypothetical protein
MVSCADFADFAATALWRALAPIGRPTLALAAVALTSLAAGCQRQAASRAEVPPRVTTAPAEAQKEPAAVKPPSGPQDVPWEQLDLGMEPDSVYEPWMLTTRVKILEGQPIRITGFMSGAILQKNNIRTFPLMREKECPFGPGGQAHHVIEVELDASRRTEFTTEPITVEGVFSVKPWTGPNGKTWSLYRLDGAKIRS